MKESRASRAAASTATRERILQPLSLRHNFSWTLVGTVIYAGCQWLALIVLTKLTPPEMVGQFALGLAIAAPVMLFANLALRTVQATDARRQFGFSDYLAVRMLTTPVALLTITVIAFLWNATDTAWIVFMVGVAKAIESFSDVIYGLMQKHERMDRMARSQMLRGSLALVGMSVAIYLTRDVFWGVVAMATAWVGVLLVHDVKSIAFVPESKGVGATVREGLRRTVQWDRVVPLLKVAAPLGFVAMLMSLNPNVPRYLIKGFIDERALGIFAALAYLLSVGTTVINAMGQTANPRLAKYYAAGNRKGYRKLLFRMFAFGAAIGVGMVALGAAFGSEVLTLLYTAEYAENSAAFVTLLVAGAVSFLASFAWYGITAARSFRSQVPLFLGAVGVNVVSGILLIPRFELVGAALSVVCAMAWQLIGCLWILRGVEKNMPSASTLEFMTSEAEGIVLHGGRLNEIPRTRR